MSLISATPADDHVSADADGATDRGNHRRNNEDQFIVADLVRDLVVHRSSVPFVPRSATEPQAKLLAVADGIGGHVGGELASAVAIETITTHFLISAPWFWREDRVHDTDFVHDLEESVGECEHRLRDVSRGRGYTYEDAPGTTLTLAYVLGRRAYILHVGDSRCYLHRNGRLFQVTSDHTLAGELSRRRPEDQPLAASLGHILVNAIGGTADNVHAEVRRVNLRAGDALLLCTDGLYNEVAPEVMEEIMTGAEDSSSACRALIAAAKQADARDNVTAVVCRFV